MNCFTPSHPLFAALLLSAPVVMADTLRVPEDYATIQEAATASTNGDIIDLGPGTWYQNVYGLSGVTLKGRDGPAKTIIDGTGHDWSPIVMYGDPCTIEGITFRNGVGSDIFGLVRGGAIYVEFTSATIRDCRFENNIINGGQNTTRIGGAICGFYSNLSITNCDFVSNGAEMGGAEWFTLKAAVFMTTRLVRAQTLKMRGACYRSAQATSQPACLLTPARQPMCCPRHLATGCRLRGARSCVSHVRRHIACQQAAPRTLRTMLMLATLHLVQAACLPLPPSLATGAPPQT